MFLPKSVLPGQTNNLSTTVEISVACRNLTRADLFSKSDPMVVLHLSDFGSTDKFTEHGRTEVIKNEHDPIFAKRFEVTYRFEERQLLRFKVHEVDTSEIKGPHDYGYVLGTYECSLGEAVSMGRTEATLVNKYNTKQKIIISVEENSNAEALKHHYSLSFAAQLYSRMWFCSRSLHFEVSREDQAGEKAVAHRSPKKRSKGRYMYKRFCRWAEWDVWDTNLGRICGLDGNKQRNLWFTVNSNDSPHSELVTTLEDLSLDVSTGDPKILPLFEPGSAGEMVGNKSELGKLWVTKFDYQYVHSFLDFIQTGTRLECAIAIDFTASNGNVKSPSSLHHISPVKPNDYMLAIRGVGSIIEDYDTDKQLPLLGFGATLPSGEISHDFFVNGNPSNPYCAGVRGVLEAYIQCLQTVELAGPTNFAPVINHAARTAQANAGTADKYHILLILTDGQITDMQKTKEALIDASALPLSVIIVGVGKADFGSMNILDGDDKRLTHNGRSAERDIVQFVALQKYLKNDDKRSIAGAELAREVLAEVPAQFAAYMKMHRLKPLKDPLEARRKASVHSMRE